MACINAGMAIIISRILVIPFEWSHPFLYQDVQTMHAFIL